VVVSYCSRKFVPEMSWPWVPNASSALATIESSPDRLSIPTLPREKAELCVIPGNSRISTISPSEGS